MHRKGKLTATSHSLQSNTAKVPIGLGGFQFSQQIANKYGISRRYWRLPSLIFSRLFDTRAAEKKINIYHKRLIDNIFTSHFLYLKVIIQLIHTTGSNSYFQKLHNLIHYDYGKTKLYPETTTSLTHTIRILQDINKRNEAPYQSSANQNVPDFYLTARNLIYSAFTKQSQRVKNELQQNDGEERNPILVPVLYQRTGLADIPSGVKDTASATFFRNIVDVEIASSKQDRRIHYPASLIQPLHYKRQFPVKMLSGPLESKNTVPNLKTRAATIALDSVKPIIRSHLQRTVDGGNDGLKVNRPVYPLPSEIQVLNKDGRSLELSTIQTVTQFPIDKNAVTKRSGKPLLQDNRVTNNIRHENISKEDDGNRRNILFPVPYLQTRPATIALDSVKPMIGSHLQRTVNVNNVSLKNNIAIYPLSSELQVLNKAGPTSELLPIKSISRSSADKKSIIKSADIPLLLRKSVLVNIISGIPYEKGDEGGNGNLMYAFNRRILKRTTDLFSKKESFLQGINFKYADHIHKKRNSSGLQDGTSDIYYNSFDMVHKKPLVQKIDDDLEVDEFLPSESKTSRRLSEGLIKESSVETQTHEISIIAEKVYKIIEKKISIEKDRRGLF